MINLLPPEQKEKHRIYSLAYVVTLIYVVIGVGLFLTAAAIATYNFTQQASNTDQQAKLNALLEQKNKNKDVATKASFIDDRLKNRGTYQEKVQWEEVLTAVANATPTNTTLTSMKISTDPKTSKITASLSGTSPDRRSVLLFQSRLSQNKTFPTSVIQSINEGAAVGDGFTFAIEATVELQNADKK